MLDVGCGDGALAATAAGSPLQVIGIDAAAATLRAARRHGPTMRADVAALPVADAAVDAVVAVNIYSEHEVIIPQLLHNCGKE